MAKNVLKAWLVDNTVTTENKTDKIFQLESTRSADQDYIIDRMVAKNPGLHRDTMELAVKLHNEVVAEEVLNGVSVTTGLFHAVAQFRGTAGPGDTWDPKKNSVYISFIQGKTLREAIADTRIDILGDRPKQFYIGSGYDVATKATDFSATAGRSFTVYGRNIALAAAIAYKLGLSKEEIAEGAEALDYVPHRLQPYRANGVTILDDAYNANIVGAKEAVNVLRLFGGRKFIVTPGLVELGVLEESENAALGEKLAGLDRVILVGATLVTAVKRGYLAAGGDAEKIVVVPTLDKAEELLAEELAPGDAVLFLNDLPDIYN